MGSFYAPPAASSILAVTHGLDRPHGASTGQLPTDVPVSVTGALAAEVVAEAIVRGVRAAKSVDGWPAAADLR